MCPVWYQVCRENPMSANMSSSRYTQLVRMKMGPYDHTLGTRFRMEQMKRACNEARAELSIERAKVHIMASRIKRAFRRAISDPHYKMCRDRLMREFNTMESN